MLTHLRHRNLGGWLCLLAFILQLTGEFVQASSNVTTKNYSVTVNAAAGAQTLEYDSNGNLTKMRNAANVVTRLCEWDAVNQLKAVQSAEALAAGVKRSEFEYDGGGRRVRQIEKEHDGTAWTTVSDWRYVWDGLELVQKRDATSNAVLKNYFAAGECGAGFQPADSLVYLPDHLGSPRSWYRVSDGTRGEADYSAYGERTVTSTGPGVPERSFTGHLMHAASGLILAPFRAYDAELGRWISEDPIGESGGMNLYSYLAGGVVGGVDPLGLFQFNASRFVWGLAKGFGLGVAIGAGVAITAAFAPLAATVIGVGLLAAGVCQAVRVAQNWHCISDDDKSELAGGIMGGVLGGRLGASTGKAFAEGFKQGMAAKSVANPVPSTLARVIPEGIPATTLGKPGAVDVFVTAADDIAGMNATQIAQRLSIPSSPAGFKVVQFPTPQSGIASPVFRTDPGFIGGGRSAGGAREFVILNGPFPTGSTIYSIR